MVLAANDDGHSLLAHRPKIRRGGFRGLRWVRDLGICLADSDSSPGAALPRSRDSFPRAGPRRGRESLLATTRLVFSGSFRGDGMARLLLAGGHRGSLGPMGYGLGPRPHAATDFGPVAWPCVRCQGSAGNSAARFETIARARIERPATLNRM